jgi:hypothetical protein
VPRRADKLRAFPLTTNHASWPVAKLRWCR